MSQIFSAAWRHGLTVVAVAVAVGAGACSWLAAAEATPKAATSRPNVIVIMADDMGFSDIGCYGGEIQTPVLNGLAAQGLRFSQFYNTSRCCPTRASLLTGLYPHQAGIGHMMEDRGFDGYRGDLSQNCVTIAEVLHDANYATYAVGKWHVTKKVRPDGPQQQENWPLQRGFDRFYGTIHGAGSFFDPNSLTRDNTLISPFADPAYTPETYYYTDAIGDNAVQFLADHASQGTDRPFFLYVAYTAAHWPMHALEADVARYRGVYDQGFAHIRQGRLARSRSLGLVDVRWPMSPQALPWGEVGNQEFEIRCMEVYAAMVHAMDRSIGRLVDELRRQGTLDNTVIFYLQDNGGCAEGMGRGGKKQAEARADAPSLPPMAADALQFDMIPKQTRDGFPVRQGYGVMPGGADTYIGYGEGWANVSNTPFREYKHWVHEGGIATPLIVHWPAGIPAGRRGDLVHTPGHLIDIMATCVDLAEADYPEQRGGASIKPAEGISLVPAFAGGTLERTQPIFWEHEGNRAVRDGRWKLVAKEGKPWELYDMETDRTELHDLAADRPRIVKRLEAAWDEYAAGADVLPLGAWRGNK
jgi:arylsulfatase A-like enzyme